ncbi:hypothetical protein GALMADRAFT_1347206 [Galerina marginata CBS 339.88]|uniref:Uncharacterized protein n=1 Tax=Galerina marginata (strain CBS 339.88) TaxID=685588 RepID=A0A067TH51_GALM3|nr:hypothetical protein GALMADRAFT_1347206 [Galerina marginata CBS 339.88]
MPFELDNMRGCVALDIKKNHIIENLKLEWIGFAQLYIFLVRTNLQPNTMPTKDAMYHELIMGPQKVTNTLFCVRVRVLRSKFGSSKFPSGFRLLLDLILDEKSRQASAFMNSQQSRHIAHNHGSVIEEIVGGVSPPRTESQKRQNEYSHEGGKLSATTSVKLGEGTIYRSICSVSTPRNFGTSIPSISFEKQTSNACPSQSCISVGPDAVGRCCEIEGEFLDTGAYPQADTRERYHAFGEMGGRKAAREEAQRSEGEERERGKVDIIGKDAFDQDPPPSVSDYSTYLWKVFAVKFGKMPAIWLPYSCSSARSAPTRGNIKPHSKRRRELAYDDVVLEKGENEDKQIADGYGNPHPMIPFMEKENT